MRRVFLAVALLLTSLAAHTRQYEKPIGPELPNVEFEKM